MKLATQWTRIYLESIHRIFVLSFVLFLFCIPVSCLFSIQTVYIRVSFIFWFMISLFSKKIVMIIRSFLLLLFRLVYDARLNIFSLFGTNWQRAILLDCIYHHPTLCRFVFIIHLFNLINFYRFKRAYMRENVPVA